MILFINICNSSGSLFSSIPLRVIKIKKSDKEILEKFDCKIYLKTICIEMQLYNYNPIRMKCQTPANHLKRTGNDGTTRRERERS